MEINKVTVDQKREQEGAWVELDDETSFLLASTNSRKYRRTFQQKLTALRQRGRKVKDEDSEDAIIECYAETIVLGWRGVTKDGKPFDFTVENVKWVLKHCPTVREFIYSQASAHENFRIDQVEEAKASLGEGSAGS